MATQTTAGSISGKLVFISVNQGDDETPDWEVFACSTSDGFSMTVDSVTQATKCDGDFVSNLPTDVSWEFTTTALAIKDEELESGQASYDTAFEIASTKAIRQFKIATADNAYYRMGEGFISSLGDTADSSDYLTYDLTITGTGQVTNIPPTT